MAKIYISPSTQEHNQYVINGNTEEYWMNKIADVVCDLLTKSGMTVYRNKPEMELKQVVADSNAKKPDVHFAIHSNAGGGRGCEVYAWLVYDDKGKIKPTEGYKLAQAVYNRVSALTPTGDRGVKQGDWLYEIKHTIAPAALIEVAFHDNPADAVWITSNIETISKAIAQGICDYFGMKLYEQPKPASKPASDDVAPDGKLFRVQVGAFKNRSNAEKLLTKLKKAGFDGYIKLE